MLKRPTSPRKYDYCSACTFYLGAIISTLICQATAGVLSAGLAGSFPDIAKNGDFNTAFMIFVQVVNGAFIFFFSWLNNYKFDFTLFADKAQKKSKLFYVALFVVPVLCAGLLLTGMYLPTVWYGYFTTYVLKMSPDIGNISIDTSSALAMLIIASVFLAPVCEEIIYRGVLATGLRKKKSATVAIVLSALAFMLMHMSPAQVVFQFALGAVSAFILLKSGRLLPSILLHATANSLALVIDLTPLGAGLGDCVAWLTNNIAAAFFITLGLFVACGAIIFVLVWFGFNLGKTQEKTEAEGQANPSADGESGEQKAPEAVKRDEIISAARDREGKVRFFIGIGICALLLIVNLVAGYF
ncbi:MAG: CPBP family intramembrane metalloprotease [Clostridiales bacterium]|nr:CPBP family intramembrane metalloprotease [Clostridiales bacterium]